MDGWNTIRLPIGALGLFSGAFAVSFREGSRFPIPPFTPPRYEFSVVVAQSHREPAGESMDSMESLLETFGWDTTPRYIAKKIWKFGEMLGKKTRNPL